MYNLNLRQNVVMTFFIIISFVVQRTIEWGTFSFRLAYHFLMRELKDAKEESDWLTIGHLDINCSECSVTNRSLSHYLIQYILTAFQITISEKYSPLQNLLFVKRSFLSGTENARQVSVNS